MCFFPLLIMAVFLSGEHVVDTPFWRVPVGDWLKGLPIDLLYAPTVVRPTHVRMPYSCILGDFAEEVLNVNQLESPATEGVENKV